MKISYSVLWFDDTNEYFDSLDLDPLKEAIQSWGFTPEVKLVTNPDDFMSYEPFREFDLIVVDYNLEDYGHGQEFIKQIRDHDIFTEVIFYSANPARDLWDAVRKKELEGVFISGRSGVLTKIEKVAEQSVRKMLDLENVRGIVMAEVGSIDIQLDMIVSSAFEGISEEHREKIFKRYVERLHKQNKDSSDRINALDFCVIEPLLGVCDSNKKWNIFQSVGKIHSDIDMDIFGDYAAEVLKPRNFLAHGIPHKQEDGSFKFEHYGKTYIFDDEASVNLRSKIQNYSSNFDKTYQDL